MDQEDYGTPGLGSIWAANASLWQTPWHLPRGYMQAWPCKVGGQRQRSQQLHALFCNASPLLILTWGSDKPLCFPPGGLPPPVTLSPNPCWCRPHGIQAANASLGHHTAAQGAQQSQAVTEVGGGLGVSQGGSPHPLLPFPLHPAPSRLPPAHTPAPRTGSTRPPAPLLFTRGFSPNGLF